MLSFEQHHCYAHASRGVEYLLCIFGSLIIERTGAAEVVQLFVKRPDMFGHVILPC